MKAENGQLSLLPVLALDENINRVFVAVEKLGADGKTVIGQTVKVKGRKDLGKELSLTGKTNADKLTDEVLKGTDGLKAQLVVLAQKYGNDPRFTGVSAQIRETKDGEVGIALKFKSVKRKEGASVEQIAKAFFPDVQYPEMTMDEKIVKVTEMMESQRKQLQAPIES